MLVLISIISTILLWCIYSKTLLEVQAQEYVKKSGCTCKHGRNRKKTIMQPWRIDQVKELVRLIRKDTLNDGPKKNKRLKRLDIIMQQKKYLTEDQRLLILRLATNENNVIEKSTEGCLSIIVSCFLKLCDIMMGYITIFINYFTKKVLIPRNWYTFKDPSSETNAFITMEMHNNLLLYYIGIQIGDKILQKLISLYPHEYEDGDFYMIAKGGCVLALDLLSLDLNDKEVKQIFELFGRGDADFGLHVRPGNDLFHSAISKDCRMLMNKTISIFEKNASISKKINNLVTPSLKEKGYILAERPSVVLKNIEGILGFFFIEQLNSERTIRSNLYSSFNYTLKFERKAEKGSSDIAQFWLFRIAISFMDHHGKLFKSEVIDIAIPGKYDDGYSNTFRKEMIPFAPDMSKKMSYIYTKEHLNIIKNLNKKFNNFY
jgi:hypothetical protein